MRILQFGKYWKKDGGIETHVKSLCKGLAKEGCDIVNIVSSTNHHEYGSFVEDGYKIVEKPTFGIYASTSICPSMVLAAHKLHLIKPFDLIHLHFPDPMSHLASMAISSSIPRVITWHSDIVKQKFLRKIYSPWQKSILMHSAAIIDPTGSHFKESNQIPPDFPKEHRHIIPFGLDYSRFELTQEQEQRSIAIRSKIVNHDFIIYALGRHVEYKGFNILLEALKSTNAFLVLGGIGPLTEKLKRLAKELNIADRVMFTGRVSDAEKIAYFHSCDVFCLPSISKNEAFGLVQLEAMACGKPVICTNLGNGVNKVNIHNETGLTVPVNDVSSLANAINTLAKNPALKNQLGKQARNRISREFSLEKMCREHIKVYSTVVK